MSDTKKSGVRIHLGQLLVAGLLVGLFDIPITLIVNLSLSVTGIYTGIRLLVNLVEEKE
jgi:hypothetical protein